MQISEFIKLAKYRNSTEQFIIFFVLLCAALILRIVYHHNYIKKSWNQFKSIIVPTRFDIYIAILRGTYLLV